MLPALPSRQSQNDCRRQHVREPVDFWQFELYLNFEMLKLLIANAFLFMLYNMNIQKQLKLKNLNFLFLLERVSNFVPFKSSKSTTRFDIELGRVPDFLLISLNKT